jgi:hypothetical protein
MSTLFSYLIYESIPRHGEPACLQTAAPLPDAELKRLCDARTAYYSRTRTGPQGEPPAPCGHEACAELYARGLDRTRLTSALVGTGVGLGLAALTRRGTLGTVILGALGWAAGRIRATPMRGSW